MSNNFVLQLRQEYGVIINSDAFLSAFTMESEERHIRMGPWLLGPGYRPKKPADQCTPFVETDYELVDQEEAQGPMRNKWNMYYVHTAGHIPYAVLKSNGAQPLVTDDDDEDLEPGGKGFDDEESDTNDEELGTDEKKQHGGIRCRNRCRNRNRCRSRD